MGEKDEKKSEGENKSEKKSEGENKSEKKNEGEKKVADGGDKKDDGPTPIVLKLDLHCEGCAKKVKRFIRNFDGVEDVKADCGSNKLTVKGNVDPSWLREKVEEKTKKKVELLSPQPKKDGGGGGDKKSDEKKKDEDKKPKEHQVSTVVFQTRLHCDGCAHKIRRIVKKVDGVEHVSTDREKDLVTVKGTMDLGDLTSCFKEKLKGNVELVPPKKNDGGDDKKGKDGGGEKKEKEEGKEKGKEGGGGGDGEKKDVESKGGGAGGGEKKDAESKGAGGGGGGDGDKGKANIEEPKVDVNKLEYQGHIPDTYYGVPMYNKNYASQDYGVPTVYNHNYAGPSYMMEYRHQPVPEYHHQYVTNFHPRHVPPLPPPVYLTAHDQMPEDENPNACSVM